MSTTPPPDSELHELLHTWKVEPREDPALARNVWARLETSRAPAGSGGWLPSLMGALARPAFAVAAVAMFAAVGAVAGELLRAGRHEARLAQLAVEYARSIDPIWMTTPAGSAVHVGHTAHGPGIP